MDAGTACAVLGVRRQTLYAYVSRGLLRACRDHADPRRSLYARADVEALAARHRRPRARADVAAGAIRWGDPVLDTSVAEVRDGMLWFGRRRAVELADWMTLEQIAALHWRMSAITPGYGRGQDGPDGKTPLARGLADLAGRAARAAPMQGRPRAELAGEGAQLLFGLTRALLGRDLESGVPIHGQLARHWAVDPSGEDTIRRALVLLSDHDLNPSTFAVRICASTGASLPAAILAGLATLSGPRHGGVALKAREALRTGADPDAMEAFLASHRELTPYGFGFGHPHYPEGDARATALFEAMGEGCPAVQQARALSQRLGMAPNIDAALAAMAEAYALPEAAAFTLFAVARTVGWTAHAIEQIESGQIIRPRARFVSVAT